MFFITLTIMFKTIWSEDCDGYPDQEASHIFIPFIPFVYAYVWLNFYRNGCFSKIAPEHMTEHRKDIGYGCYYKLFIH